MAQKDSALHKNHRFRMRKRFKEHGFDGFEEHEILELLLFFSVPRRDTNLLAHTILDEYKTLANVFEADAETLAKIPGVGENSATLLSMMSHLFRAYEKSKYKRGIMLRDTEAIGRFATSILNGKVNEEFAMICLDAHRRVHWSGVIAKGTIDRIDAYPRMVVSEVLKHDGKYVIFAHNHPKGSLMASYDDKQTTKVLVDILKTIDVTVIDHMIVCDKRYYSMAEAGFIF